MSNAASFDELLNRAFQLAYFIHADKQTALRSAFEVGKLKSSVEQFVE